MFFSCGESYPRRVTYTIKLNPNQDEQPKIWKYSFVLHINVRHAQPDLVCDNNPSISNKLGNT